MVKLQVNRDLPLTELYSNYPWGDLWSEGGLLEVAQYLRASKHLNIPSEWRAVLPEYVHDEPMSDTDM